MKNLPHVLLALTAAAALTGCGGPDNGPPPVVRTQATIDTQIEKIKQDPNMTPEAKEGAIRGIQTSFEASQRAAAQMKNGQGKP